MSFILPINGKNYTIPQTGDLNWGGNVDDFFTALSTIVSPFSVNGSLSSATLTSLNSTSIINTGVAVLDGYLYVDGYAAFQQQLQFATQPSDPSPIINQGQLYAKNDGYLYFMAPGGAVSQLTTPHGAVSGGGTSGQIAYWNASNAITGSSGLTYSGGNLTLSGNLTVNGSTVTQSSSQPSATVGLTINNTSSTAPNSQLSLTAGTQNWILANTSGNFNFYNANTSSYAGYFQNATNYLILNNRLGIGTSSPKSLLDIAGNITIGSYAGSTAAPTNGMIISGNTSIGTSSNVNKLDVSAGMSIGYGNSPSTAPINGLIVSGQLGVGTSSPIASSAATFGPGAGQQFIQINGGHTSAGEGSAVLFSNTGGIGSSPALFGTSYITNMAISGTSTVSLYTSTNALAQWIDASQNIGFGNSSPSTSTPAAPQNGVSILPGNTSGTSTMATVYGDIYAQGGFRQTVGPFTFYDTTSTTRTGSSSNWLFDIACYNINGAGSANFVNAIFVPQFSGTIVGMSAIMPNSTMGAVTLTIQPYIANTATTIHLSFPGGTGPYYTQATKDSSGNTFTGGQSITMSVSNSSAAGIAGLLVWLTIEC